MQQLFDLRVAMPRHWLPCISTQPSPREAEDFSRCSKYPKDVHLPTYLDKLQRKGTSSLALFNYRLRHESLYHLVTGFEPTLN